MTRKGDRHPKKSDDKRFRDRVTVQGATRQAITKVQIENFKISLPNTIQGQENVIKKINALSTETKKLEAIYQQKLTDLEELKKSVLQKAFNGELTSASSVLKKEVIL